MDYGTLITDRTLEDVELWQTLRHKDFSAMDTQEQAQWLASLKGTYNISDLNRVGEAVKDLTDRLYSEGYIAKTAAKLDWVIEDVPTIEQLYTYINNIKTLRVALALPVDTPQVPDEMNKMQYNEANYIEQILVALDSAIKCTIEGNYFCNELFCGEI